jgi:N-acetyl-anhydromuramyl-L-alanine amidase AmpD
MTINRSFRLPDTDYFAGPFKKTGICIHHTVGGTAASTMDWWLRDGKQVGTAYIIDRDGTIYEVFDPKAWAWQFGLRWPVARKTPFERRFIGIEIASEGGLIESNGNLYCFDRVTDKTKKSREEALDYGKDYRGYRYFDKYETAQMNSLIELLNHLLSEFQIPRVHPDKPLAYYGDWLEKFKGIIGHTMVRKDKSDPIPDPLLWEHIRRDCNVTPVTVTGN